jgi:hypothetical protein
VISVTQCPSESTLIVSTDYRAFPLGCPQCIKLGCQCIVHRYQRSSITLEPSDVCPGFMELVDEHEALMLVAFELSRNT